MFIHKTITRLLFIVIMLMASLGCRSQLVGSFLGIFRERDSARFELLELDGNGNFHYEYWNSLLSKTESDGTYCIEDSVLCLDTRSRYSDYVQELVVEDVDSINRNQRIIVACAEDDMFAEPTHALLYLKDSAGNVIVDGVAAAFVDIPHEGAEFVVYDSYRNINIRHSISDPQANRFLLFMPTRRVFENERWKIVDSNTIVPFQLHTSEYRITPLVRWLVK